MADEAKRRERRREDQAAAIARLAAVYGDADPVELARRVVAAAAAADGPDAAQQEHLVDALWAVNAVRAELDELELDLLGDVAALIEDRDTALTWGAAAEPYGITGAGLSARWQRRRPTTTEHED